MVQARKCRALFVFTALLWLQCHLHYLLQRYFRVLSKSESICAFSVSAFHCAFRKSASAEGRRRKRAALCACAGVGDPKILCTSRSY